MGIVIGGNLLKQYLSLKSKAMQHEDEKKLFFVVDDGDSSMTVPETELAVIIKHGFGDYSASDKEEDLPTFTVSPVYMTQEEFDNMPEYNG
jgi:hypothetical protein